MTLTSIANKSLLLLEQLTSVLVRKLYLSHCLLIMTYG